MDPNYKEIQLLIEKHHTEWEWFVQKYFGKRVWELFLDNIKYQNTQKLLSTMKDWWYYLPDNPFNIKENPEGWSSFINIIDHE